MSTTLEASLSQLEKYGPIHAHLGLQMLQAAGAKAYPLDFLAVAAINRSANIHSGFTLLIQNNNFLSAAALLRLQLDTCLRFYAAFLVSDPHHFALSVYGGTPVRNLKARDGKYMFDAYLVAELTKNYPWVQRIYDLASGYVHLSENHFFDAIRKKEGTESTLSIKIGAGSEHISDSAYAEIVDTFCEVTKLFLSLIYRWTETKDNPITTPGNA